MSNKVRAIDPHIVDGIVEHKPPAVVYIDDRAICFDGDSKSLLSKIEKFKPWNKR